MGQAAETVYIYAFVSMMLLAAVNGVTVRLFRMGADSYSAAVRRLLGTPFCWMLLAYAAGCLIGWVWSRLGAYSPADIIAEMRVVAALLLGIIGGCAGLGFYTAHRWLAGAAPERSFD